MVLHLSDMSGVISTRSIVINEDSGSLDQFIDVIITSATHDQTIKYDSTNWVNTTVTLQELGDTDITSISHNDVLIWNSTTSKWENGKLSSLLITLSEVVNGIVSIQLSVFIGEQGDPARSVCVAFTDTPENGATLAIASCGDNNVVYKKEPSDINFSYYRTMNRGEIYHDSLPAGTVFSSAKGIAGCTSPFPTPFGVSCLADTYFRFFALRQDVYVYATSAGRDSLVTVFASDETTIVGGPTFINAYGSTTFMLSPLLEYVVTSTTDIFCGTGSSNGAGIANARTDVRLIPPMRCEVIVHNRLNRVTAQFTDTDITWYRQDMDIGSLTANAGTPLQIGTVARAGTVNRFANHGWLILRSNKPMSSFTGADGAGSNAVAGWPIEFLAQMFPIYSVIGTSADFHQAGINIASPYEGEARIYDNTGTLIFTFPYTRGTSPPVTPNDQLFPAAGQSNPATDGYAALTGGWIETTTPAVCVINFIGAATGDFGQSDNGDETLIPGTSPDEFKAQIRKDPDGFLRRRDIDVAGNETWNLC